MRGTLHPAGRFFNVWFQRLAITWGIRPVQAGRRTTEKVLILSTMSIVEHQLDLTAPPPSRKRVVRRLPPRLLNPVMSAWGDPSTLVWSGIAPGHSTRSGVHVDLCIAVRPPAAVPARVNRWYEAKHRTHRDFRATPTARPRGRRHRSDALRSAWTLAFFSVMTLGILVNWFPRRACVPVTMRFATVGGSTTMWLEAWTGRQNIVDRGPAGRACRL